MQAYIMIRDAILAPYTHVSCEKRAMILEARIRVCYTLLAPLVSLLLPVKKELALNCHDGFVMALARDGGLLSGHMLHIVLSEMKDTDQ